MKQMNIRNFTYNKIIMAGAVATAPVLKELGNDHCVCYFELLTHSVRGKREYSNTHKVVCHGKMARNIFESVSVSDIILIEGELIYREVPSPMGPRLQAEINAFSTRLIVTEEASSRLEEDAMVGSKTRMTSAFYDSLDDF